MSNFLVNYSIRNGEYETYQHLIIKATDIEEATVLFERVKQIDEKSGEACILLHNNYEESLSLEQVREVTDAECKVLEEVLAMFVLDAPAVSELVATYDNDESGEEADEDEDGAEGDRECDNCPAPLTNEAYQAGQGLCTDCINSIN